MTTPIYHPNTIPLYDNESHAEETIFFSPANAIPIKSYSEFFSFLFNDFRIQGVDNRGAWAKHPPNKSNNWQQYAADLIAVLEKRISRPVIAMGHSMGAAVTVIAATQRPDLFKKIICIDPASIPGAPMRWVYPYLPKYLSFKLIPIIGSTHNRRQLWPSIESFYQHYRTHAAFKHFTDTSLRNYAKECLVLQDDGLYRLRFHPHWESHNFRRAQFLWKYLQEITVPTLLIRAEHSYLYTQTEFDARVRKTPSWVEGRTLVNSHHLLSHEKPEELSALILDWI